jgi:hypothetical protein
VNSKLVLALALVLTSTCMAQSPPSDPGAMSCADYLRAAKGTSEGVFGNVKTGDAEADAMMKELGQKVRKVCTASPKITVREAIQQAIMEED